MWMGHPVTVTHAPSPIRRIHKHMALHTSTAKASIAVQLTCLFLPLFIPRSYSSELVVCQNPKSDVDLLEFPLNLEYLEAEFFLLGATGHGLFAVAPELAQGGPHSIGSKLALDTLTRDVIVQFALQEVGHLRAIKSAVKGFPRPLLNISKESFAQVMDSAFGEHLHPPFDPYANSINCLLASYVIPYVGLTGDSAARKGASMHLAKRADLAKRPGFTGYVGAIPELPKGTSMKLVAGLLAVESGQDAVIRAMLYAHRELKVKPYAMSVAEFTSRISMLRNKLGNKGLKDEGLEVPRLEGAEGKVSGNVLAGDKYSLAYPRAAEEILRIVYGGGDEHVPGGFFPKGAHVRIARSYLKSVA